MTVDHSGRDKVPAPTGRLAPTDRLAPTGPPAPRPRPEMRRSLVEAPRRLLNSAIHAGWSWLAEHGATGPGDEAARRFGSFGEGSCLAFPPGATFGEQWIAIGADTLVGPHVSISAGMVPGQQMVTYPVVRIGDRCMIGRGSHIVGHFNLEIGDDVHTGPYVYITDQNHGYEDPDVVVHRQWPSDVPVRIGSGSWLGTGVVVLPGTELGANVVVGAGAVVRGVFPDHCVIAGVPARIMRRYVPGSGWVEGAAGWPDGSVPRSSRRSRQGALEPPLLSTADRAPSSAPTAPTAGPSAPTTGPSAPTAGPSAPTAGPSALSPVAAPSASKPVPAAAVAPAAPAVATSAKPPAPTTGPDAVVDAAAPDRPSPYRRTTSEASSRP